MRKFSFEKVYPKVIIAVTLLAVGIVFFRNMFPPLENAIVLDAVSSTTLGASSAVIESNVYSSDQESVSSVNSRSTDNSGNFEPININTAAVSELITLDGIGESRAKAIIEYREANGGFKSVDELTKVSGIGEKTLEKNRSRITV